MNSNVTPIMSGPPAEDADMETILRNTLSFVISEKQEGREIKYGVITMFQLTPDEVPNNEGDIHVINTTGALRHQIAGLMAEAQLLLLDTHGK